MAHYEVSGTVLETADDGLLRTTVVTHVAPVKLGEVVSLVINGHSGFHRYMGREPGVDLWRCVHS